MSAPDQESAKMAKTAASEAALHVESTTGVMASGTSSPVQQSGLPESRNDNEDDEQNTLDNNVKGTVDTPATSLPASAVNALLQAAASAASSSSSLLAKPSSPRWAGTSTGRVAGGSARPVDFSDDDENDEVVDADSSIITDGRRFVETVYADEYDEDGEDTLLQMRLDEEAERAATALMSSPRDSPVDATTHGGDTDHSFSNSEDGAGSGAGSNDDSAASGGNRSGLHLQSVRVAPADTAGVWPSSPLAQPPTNADSLVQNGSTGDEERAAANTRRRHHAHGYHPAELVHFSIYYPELSSASYDAMDAPVGKAEEGLDALEERRERRQVLYYYDRPDLILPTAPSSAAGSASMSRVASAGPGASPSARDGDGAAQGARPNGNHEHGDTIASVLTGADQALIGLQRQQRLQRQMLREQSLWDARLRKIGLARALAEFCGTFADTPTLDNVHSQRHRWAVVQPEPGFWILAEIALGRHVRPMRSDRHKVEVEYVEASVDDACSREVLFSGYQSFRLCHGRFADQLKNSGRDTFGQRLAEHFDPLAAHWHFDRPDIHVALNGINFAPMSRTSRLAVDQLLSDLRTRLNQVRHTMLLWNDQLVSTDIADATEACTLWHLLSRQYMPGKESVDGKGRKRRNSGRRKHSGAFAASEINAGDGEANTGSAFWHPANLLRTITPSFLSRSLTPTQASQLASEAGSGAERAHGLTDAQTEPSAEANSEPDATVGENNSMSRQASESNDIPPSVPRFMVPIPIPAVTGRFLTGAVTLSPNASPGAIGAGADIPRSSGASDSGSSTDSNIVTPPVIHLGDDAVGHHLVIYQCPPNLLLAVLIPLSSAPQLTSLEFYRALHDHIAAPAEAVNYRMSQERRSAERIYADRVKSYRFVHLDRKTRAIRSTLSVRRMRSDVRECLLQMHETFTRDPDTRELCDRLCTSGRWVLARRDSRREVYFVVDRKDATLVQVEEEFRRFSAVDIGQVVSDR
ncbi:hypothetical protein THASP1DRAFT_30874 [Thamnocephalis sphaerospora]|uniref:CCZ1/INTU/HSP4 first Longin domain-containing protein n=1 Tax=Thamnocephalis sphaerospora TaxID=78915 RepID=A0A4P9XN06_9FUNG|nr:hypothetical protein THASP1DRAFT_30874 [Thamnocephalis sphaerospora]|eukprot:RKP07313.1 hypothetical protein THASP1DRAFT_30874 [Thamnocephalis sphaerospora]